MLTIHTTLYLQMKDLNPLQVLTFHVVHFLSFYFDVMDKERKPWTPIHMALPLAQVNLGL
jgi:hypothetical protein